MAACSLSNSMRSLCMLMILTPVSGMRSQKSDTLEESVAGDAKPKPDLARFALDERCHGAQQKEGSGLTYEYTAATARDYWRHFKPPNPCMQHGGKGEALIPELVPPPGAVYEFWNKEKPTLDQLVFDQLDKNAYNWELESMKFAGIGKAVTQEKIAGLMGKRISNAMGHRNVHVYNLNGTEMFHLRMTKSDFNPTKFKWSFRVLPPGSKSNKDTLFTINRDQWGKGSMWMTEEWRVYRGRKRDGELLYYGVGDNYNHDFAFYRNQTDADSGKGTVLAKIRQRRNLGYHTRWGGFANHFQLTVNPGEDSALLLVASTAIDIENSALWR